MAAREGDWIKVREPQGVGPSLAIDPIPEAKMARWEQLGAKVARVFPGSHVVMQNLEGEEFCAAEQLRAAVMYVFQIADFTRMFRPATKRVQ